MVVGGRSGVVLVGVGGRSGVVVGGRSGMVVGGRSGVVVGGRCCGEEGPASLCLRCPITCCPTSHVLCYVSLTHLPTPTPTSLHAWVCVGVFHPLTSPYPGIPFTCVGAFHPSPPPHPPPTPMRRRRSVHHSAGHVSRAAPARPRDRTFLICLPHMPSSYAFLVCLPRMKTCCPRHT